MDRQKKRKRTDNGDSNGRDQRETAVKEDTAVSEAEVDEFFSILRRMNMAMKYLQKNAQILPDIDDVASGQKRVVPRGDLDLNSLPESGY
ncbi:hypothetical protein RND71_017222 [Anisodus tanguticus]|uniref:Uncharacterized protein n=1 Tax=Anisodus tanguticus TaxID=243964 RepID=A0AAE1S1X3_9SOLA|nr:hypothetical protein RND71_017222 [Anisodus tanguticus]